MNLKTFTGALPFLFFHFKMMGYIKKSNSMYLLRRPTIYGNDPAFFRCAPSGVSREYHLQFFLPSDLSSLSVVLTYQKEHPSDPDSYFNRRRTELAPILEQYMEQPVSEDLLRREINAIKQRSSSASC